MRLLADESVDGPVVARLRADGHTVDTIAEGSPGVRDEVVLACAWQDGVVLFTADKDFGELVYRQRLPHAGGCYCASRDSTRPASATAVSQVVAGQRHHLPGAFSVLDDAALRIRRAPGA